MYVLLHFLFTYLFQHYLSQLKRIFVINYHLILVTTRLLKVAARSFFASFNKTITAAESQHSFVRLTEMQCSFFPFFSFQFRNHYKRIIQWPKNSHCKIHIRRINMQIPNISLTLNTGNSYTESATEIKKYIYKNIGNLPIGKIAFLQTPLVALHAPEATE